MADQANLSWWEAAGRVYNPLQTSYSLGDAFDDLLDNGLYGVLSGKVSPSKAESLAKDEADGLVRASDGALTYDQAYAIARSDVINSLRDSNAYVDPDNPTALDTIAKFGNYAVIGVVILITLYAANLVLRAAGR